MLSFVAFLALSASAVAQPNSDLQASVALFQKVRTVPNVVYLRANGWEGKLDVYALRSPTPTPTVIFIHGGGWVQGTKEASVLSVSPYIAMGYSVVNVEYRLANVSLAPAAIEDCRCALRWVVAHAKDYNFDPDRLIVAGASAGGHLALTTDPLAPYQHSIRLQEALEKAGIAHELVTIPGGGHGNFPPDQWQRAYAAIEKFLGAHVPASKPPSSAGRP